MSRKLLTKFVNRNPRNLEMMGLQAPPTGYDLEVDRQRRSFIYKLLFFFEFPFNPYSCNIIETTGRFYMQITFSNFA